MYDELVKSLRVCGKALEDAVYPDWDVSLYTRAADAIESMSEAYDKLSRHMDDLAALMPRWIPVSERLPEIRKVVLITDGVDVGTGWVNQEWWNTSFADIQRDAVTHWMPLPQGPEEE